MDWIKRCRWSLWGGAGETEQVSSCSHPLIRRWRGIVNGNHLRIHRTLWSIASINAANFSPHLNLICSERKHKRFREQNRDEVVVRLFNPPPRPSFLLHTISRSFFPSLVFNLGHFGPLMQYFIWSLSFSAEQKMRREASRERLMAINHSTDRSLIPDFEGQRGFSRIDRRFWSWSYCAIPAGWDYLVSQPSTNVEFW